MQNAFPESSQYADVISGTSKAAELNCGAATEKKACQGMRTTVAVEKRSATRKF